MRTTKIPKNLVNFRFLGCGKIAESIGVDFSWKPIASVMLDERSCKVGNVWQQVAEMVQDGAAGTATNVVRSLHLQFLIQTQTMPSDRQIHQLPHQPPQSSIKNWIVVLCDKLISKILAKRHSSQIAFFRFSCHLELLTILRPTVQSRI